MASAPSTKSGQRNLTAGPIPSTLLAFALPTLGSNVLQSLNGSINAIWVGRFLGENALAATSNANTIMFLMFGAVFGFGMAATILVGQSFGRGDMNGAKRAFGSAIGLVLVASLMVAVLGWLFAPAILRLLATPPAAFDGALAYLRVIFAGLPGQMALVLMFMGLRGIGDSLTPLWFMALSVMLDAGLNPVFILGLGPVPRMGTAGSATATLVAGIVTVVGLTVFIHYRDSPLKLAGAERRWIVPQGALVRTILAKGLPIGAQMIVISVAGLAMVGLVNRLGVHTTAGYGVTLQMWAYVQMPALAIGAAVSAMAAQNIGAGRWDRVDAIARAGLFFNLVLTGAAVLVMLALDRRILGLFTGESSPALPIAEHINRLATWGFVLFGATMVLFGVVRANGAVWGPLLILFVSMFPVRLGFASVLQPMLGPDALWWSFPIGSAANLIGAIIFYRKGGWKRGALAPAGEQESEKHSQADTETSTAFRPAA